MSVSRAVVPSLLALSLIVAGCSKRESAPASASVASTPALAPPGQAVAQAASDLPSAQRAMRVTVETSVVVKDLDATVSMLRSQVQATGGYIAEGRVNGEGGGSRSASFEAKIPVAKLGAFRAAVAGMGEIVQDGEKAEDVTEQRADIAARVGNARAEEKRLLALLSDKTGSLSEVVTVEKEVARVRESIERMEAEQRTLEGQIAFATVKLQLSTKYLALAKPGPIARVGSAASEGLEVAGSFLMGLVVLLFTSGPTLLILAALGYASYRFVRALRHRYGKSSAAPAQL